MAICEQCKDEYDAKRATSRYCGPTCRSKASRVSVASEAELALHPLSVASVRKCGPIPGDPDYAGVALQEKFRPNWAHPEGVDFRPDDEPVKTDTQAPDPLPACVPDIIRYRYNREGDGYRATIDRLVSTTIADLLAEGVYVPVWRYNAPLPA